MSRAHGPCARSPLRVTLCFAFSFHLPQLQTRVYERMAVTPPTTSFAPTAMASSSSSSPPAKAHKLYNLILPISLSRGQVLLGYKLRGFGIGKYNGFGGKVEAGETIVASAVRELREESGMVCTENQLQHQAVLLLETVASGAEHEKVLEIHVFVCTEWSGEIAEYVDPPE